MCCTDVSCWYLQVFLGPQSMNKTRSCFFCAWTLAKKRCKSTTKNRHVQGSDAKRTKKDFAEMTKKLYFCNGNRKQKIKYYINT